MVASEPRFIQSAPSPSKTKTLRFGRESANPRPIEEQSPNVLTWMLPSLGLTPFHSAVAPPAVVTNNSFLTKFAWPQTFESFHINPTYKTARVSNNATGRFELFAAITAPAMSCFTLAGSRITVYLIPNPSALAR